MEKEQVELVRKIYRITLGILSMTLLLAVAIVYIQIDPALKLFNNKEEIAQVTPPEDDDLIENGIHVRTGLKDGESLMLVVQNCTACHSAKIIIQNKADREGWKSIIKWMQETQSLWELGENEDKIIDYLVTNYPPQKKGRRAVLTDIEWYELE
ncbi:monoheme cytochrome C [Fulvivirga sp. RKSG066]|uniref:monoheme cytochrome C n=1 Tax=Fulvivirga aurantia TaxID=2529383 RepID=UPI0012BB4B3F|nr:monoheme cytochrome C [Fulvivirga aurantia]MTI21502.1 monoheme cytochrome C [Fulvivirga aurantia]